MQQSPQSINPNHSNHPPSQNQNISPQLTQDNQQQDFVDVKEVTIQPQQIDQDKFIESNPNLAAQQKIIGNQNYSLGQYTDALSAYRRSLQHTPTLSEEDKKFRSIIYSNIGLTYMKMLSYQLAIKYFQKSLKLNQKYVKARTNLGLSYENQDKIEEALDQYKKVLEINPEDKFINQKVVHLEVKVKELQQKRKEEVIGGLKNIGNSILGYFGMSLDNFKLEQGPGGGYNISFKQ